MRTLIALRDTRSFTVSRVAVMVLGLGMLCVAPQHVHANPPPLAGVQAVPAWPGVTFNSPMCLTTDGVSMFVAEQKGMVHRVPTGPGAKPTPYLDLRTRFAKVTGQGGLLSIAFHPQFATNGRVFACYLARSKVAKFEIRVSEFKGNATSCAASSEQVLMTVPKSRHNHNAGYIAFGPDGMLYLSVGDNMEKTPEGQLLAQNGKSFYGKILCADVSTPGKVKPAATNTWIKGGGVVAYLYAFGFRNPWRFDWNAKGEMFTAEPGTKGPTSREWVTQVVPGGNHRWPYYMGTFRRTEITGTPKGKPLVLPAFEYENGTGVGAAIGGKFYRGKAVPALAGKYVFCDVMRNQVYSLDLSTGKGQNWSLVATIKAPSEIASDRFGELYVLSHGENTVHKLIAK